MPRLNERLLLLREEVLDDERREELLDSELRLELALERSVETLETRMDEVPELGVELLDIDVIDVAEERDIDDPDEGCEELEDDEE